VTLSTVMVQFFCFAARVSVGIINNPALLLPPSSSSPILIGLPVLHGFFRCGLMYLSAMVIVLSLSGFPLLSLDKGAEIVSSQEISGMEFFFFHQSSEMMFLAHRDAALEVRECMSVTSCEEVLCPLELSPWYSSFLFHLAKFSFTLLNFWLLRDNVSLGYTYVWKHSVIGMCCGLGSIVH